MPWVTPTLEQLRATNRSNVQAQLRSGPMIPNSVLRVMADSNAGLAYLVLLYINWLALQLMPDTAETQFLDRFAQIWRPAGGGRKQATYANGVIQFTSVGSIVMPAGSILIGASDTTTGTSINFATTAPATIGLSPTNVSIVALEAGTTGLSVGSSLSLQVGISGIGGSGTLSSITDGFEQETDDQLRARVLFRIQEPPMGGDSNDYVAWALAQPGVTRAWASQEMGVGSVTVRFMMDVVRASNQGFPQPTDVTAVAQALQLLRPVTVKNFLVFAPLPQTISFTINALNDNSGITFGSTATQNAIAVNVKAMLFKRSSPAYTLNGILQAPPTIYTAWVSDAILQTPNVVSFDLVMSDIPMPGNGYIAQLGTITYT